MVVDCGPGMGVDRRLYSYYAAAQLQPAVFEDHNALREAGIEVFGVWSRSLPKAPSDVTQLVRDVSTSERVVGRLVSECSGRHVAWQAKPYRGRKKVVAPPIEPASVDPWTTSATELSDVSRHYAKCGICTATGRVGCGTCSGTGRTACTQCSGAGKVYGTTAHGHQRMLNCKTCRGKGDTKCSDCTRGKKKCADCDGSKKVEQWLEISEAVRQDIQVEPDGHATQAFPWGQDGVVATDAEIALDATVLLTMAAAEAVSPESLRAAGVPQNWIAENWQDIQPRLQPGERVCSQSFTLLKIPSVSVTYGMAGSVTQTLTLEGRRLLGPPPTVDRLFKARAGWLSVAGWLLAAVPLAVGLIYLARGSYFHSLAVLGLVASVGIASVAGYGFAWNATLGRRTARRWGAPGVAALVMAAILGVVAEPSIDTARSLVASGDRDAAVRELEQLGGRVNARLRSSYAKLDLTEIKASQTWSAAWSIARSMPTDLPERAAAEGHVRSLFLAALAQRINGEQYGLAEDLLNKAPDPLKTGPEVQRSWQRIHSAVSKSCLAARKWSCALGRANALGAVGAPIAGQTLHAQIVKGLRVQADSATTEARQINDRADRFAQSKAAAALWALWATQQPESDPPKEVVELRAVIARDGKVLKAQAARAARIAAKAQARADRRAARGQARADRRAAKAQARADRLAARKRAREDRARRRRARQDAALMCRDGSLSPTCTCGGRRRGCCSHHGGVRGCSM